MAEVPSANLAAAAEDSASAPAAGIGYRVVRGPDWKWAKQDGGDGHVGTVRSFENEGEVLVLWDNGTAANYRCSTQFDVRILDSAPAGVRHNVVCNACQASPLYGIRWKCQDCPDFDLCSPCYHGDHHNLRHTFCRMTTPSSPRVVVECRRKAKKTSSRGIFPGARVVRGVDWQWEDQDGGMGHKGKVVELSNWSTASIRSGVYVVWDGGRKNLYRIGFEGRSDLKAVTEAKGGGFYKEHLPMLGEDRKKPTFRVGDHVRVDLEVEVIKTLQSGHGGWSDDMTECIGATGLVVGIDVDHDVVVKYPSENRWTFNPVILKRALMGEAPPRLSLTLPEDPFTFSVGDFVKISSNQERVKELQAGHGEWVDAMKQTLGKVGRVVQVYTDGDLKIDIRDAMWTFNSKNVSRLEGDGVPLTPGTSEGVSLLLRHMFEHHQASNPVEDLVKGASNGDMVRVEQLLDSGACSVDDQFNGKTALQAAAQNGHLDVVRTLLRYNANLEEEDKDGDRAIHHATLGDEPEVIVILSQHSVDLNARNRRKQTALHVAVNRGHVAVIKVLLNEGCHPSLQDCDGDTPLHDAISKKRDDMVQLLMLEPKVDITVTNSNGFNCLHHAALRGNTGALKLILSFLPPSCSINELKDDGFTALHLASLNNHLEAAQMLIDYGANLDIQNVNLQTPLHLAVERQNIQIVRLLVEAGACMDLGDKFGDRPLHEALRHHTMSQLKHLQEANDVGKALVMSNSDKKSSASIAIFLASNGAQLTVKNTKDQTPLDLCPDPHLLKLLTKCSLEHHKSAQSAEAAPAAQVSGREEVSLTDCSVCLKNKRDMLFIPCGHITCCGDCGLTVETCTICQQEIVSKAKIEECLVCSDVSASVLFRPCLHMIACDSCSSRMKKCVKCRTPIEASVPYIVCCGGKPSKKRRERNGSNQMMGSFGGQDEISTLQYQLQEMKEKTQCQVCMDRRKNCVFLCGHGTCQLCADKIVECPICRKTVGKKIILFD